MYTRGKLNCSVSEEISNKIFQHLLKQNIPAQEAWCLIKTHKSLKDIKAFLPLKKPSNPNPEPLDQAEPAPIIPEDNQIEADLSSFPESKRKIYKRLLEYGVDHNKALEIIFFCENEEEALMNANIDVGDDYKPSQKQAGAYLYKKSVGKIEKCSICIEVYEDNDKLKALPCFHKFHFDCIDTWIQAGKTKCPECLAEIEYN